MVSHSLFNGCHRRIDSREVSPGFSDFWPSAPLVEWPLWMVERLFDTLEALVMYEGAAQ